MDVRQVVPWARWPSGDNRPIAVLPYDVAELSRRYGLVFEAGTDDLDRYRMAAIDLGDGRQAWLTKHDQDAQPGTLVHVDAEDDIETAQAALVAAFAIDRDGLLWIAPAPLLTPSRM